MKARGIGVVVSHLFIAKLPHAQRLRPRRKKGEDRSTKPQQHAHNDLLTMLRAAASTLAKRSFQRTHVGAMAPTSASFHYSARREEEAKEPEVVKDEGFMGTGISHLYALPIGVCAAVPILEFQWFRPNEEMLLASTFVAFCVVAYTQGGAAIANGFKAEADEMLKIQNEAENEVISKMQENLDYMKLTENIVSDYEAAFALTKESYDKLNAAGKIKPAHQLKAQVEKVLSMIATEEQGAYEKAKTAMMTEATAAVTAKFLSDDTLKAAALDSALAKIAGKTAAADPVQAAFVSFFKEKTAAAKKLDAAAETKEARAAMLAKMNSIAENEGFYFRFDESGKPKMLA